MGFRKKLCPLQGRKPHRTSDDEFQIGGFQLVQKDLVPFMAIATHETQGETEVIDLSHIPLVKAQAVELLKKLLSSLRRLVVEALKLFPLPLALEVPGRAEEGFIHPGTNGKARPVIILRGKNTLLEGGLALIEETIDIGPDLLERGLFHRRRLQEISDIGYKVNKTIGQMHKLLQFFNPNFEFRFLHLKSDNLSLTFLSKELFCND
jgi:hypothetical protein